MSAELEYRAAVIALGVAERTLGATPRSDIEARAAATREVEQATARVRAAKEEVKRANQRRVFCGSQTPFYEVVAERFPNLLLELEAEAMRRQTEREARAAERRQAKEGAPAPTPPPKPAGPEVVHVIRSRAPAPAPAAPPPPQRPRVPLSRPSSRRAEVAGAFADARRART